MDNNRFENQVSTSGMTLFDENGMMLRLSYLDDSFSIVFGECQEENGKRTYPQNMRHALLMTVDRGAVMLDEIILKKVLPALEAGENYNGGVFLNRRKDAILELRVQEGDVYLCYHKDIGEDRQPKESYVFKFNKTTVVENYKTDGTSFDQSNVDGYFVLFYKYLDAGVYEVHNAGTHSHRRVMNASINRIFQYLEGIGAKLGVVVERPGYNRGGNSGFNTPSSSQPQAQDPLPFQNEPEASSSLEGLIS